MTRESMRFVVFVAAAFDVAGEVAWQGDDGDDFGRLGFVQVSTSWTRDAEAIAERATAFRSPIVSRRSPFRCRDR